MVLRIRKRKKKNDSTDNKLILCEFPIMCVNNFEYHQLIRISSRFLQKRNTDQKIGERVHAN